MCPYLNEMHERCDISELNSITIDHITRTCGRANYIECRFYRDLAKKEKNTSND